MMSAVVYKQKEWDAKVKANEEYEVVLHDANGRKLCTHTCRTDDMGVLAVTATTTMKTTTTPTSMSNC